MRAELFDRDRRQVRLTAAGESLLAVARRVLTEWDHGTVEVGDVVAEVTNADEKLELIASGAAIGMVAESNAAIYARPDLVRIPVTDLGPARLAVARRRGDRRLAVQAFVQACTDAMRDVNEPAADGTDMPAPMTQMTYPTASRRRPRPQGRGTRIRPSLYTVAR